MQAYVRTLTHLESAAPSKASTPVKKGAPGSVVASDASGLIQVASSLEEVVMQWDQLANCSVSVQRAPGVCPILSDEDETLYAPSRDCSKHTYGSQGLAMFIRTSLSTGPFPVRCPGCVAEGSASAHRGIITRSSIKGLCDEGVIKVEEGQRLLLQQIKNIPDEASLDLQFSMTKPCPYCTTPIAHYKGHGCHHIMPGGGCPTCKNHFCYMCLSKAANGNGKIWTGCPNSCPTFCTKDCDCPTCPECLPGNPCDVCDGAHSQCTVCKHGHGDDDDDDEEHDY